VTTDERLDEIERKLVSLYDMLAQHLTHAEERQLVAARKHGGAEGVKWGAVVSLVVSIMSYLVASCGGG